MFNIAYTFEEIGGNGDGYVDVGEQVDITDNTGFYVGRFTFTYPMFSFGYPVTASGFGGRATVDNTYTSESSGSAELTEIYQTSPECTIFASE